MRGLEEKTKKLISISVPLVRNGARIGPWCV